MSDSEAQCNEPPAMLPTPIYSPITPCSETRSRSSSSTTLVGSDEPRTPPDIDELQNTATITGQELIIPLPDAQDVVQQAMFVEGPEEPDASSIGRVAQIQGLTYLDRERRAMDWHARIQQEHDDEFGELERQMSFGDLSEEHYHTQSNAILERRRNAYRFFILMLPIEAFPDRLKPSQHGIPRWYLNDDARSRIDWLEVMYVNRDDKLYFLNAAGVVVPFVHNDGVQMESENGYIRPMVDVDSGNEHRVYTIRSEEGRRRPQEGEHRNLE
ncbi:unnamed protein product [Discula destructiva]